MQVRLYECKKCGKREDKVFRNMDAPRQTKCDCGGMMYKVLCTHFNMNCAYVPGVNAEHDMDVANDYYEHRMYSEDEQKQDIKAHKPNISEV